MFAPRYYARRYFAGRYWPPADGGGGGPTYADGALFTTGSGALVRADAIATEPPPVVEQVSGGGGPDRARRRRIKRERTWSIAELQAELRAQVAAAWPAVEAELAEAQPVEAAQRAEEIRDGRDLATLPVPALLALGAEVAALAPPMDAAAMLRVLIELRDEDDAAALLLLTM
jgi:hypothetical protein